MPKIRWDTLENNFLSSQDMPADVLPFPALADMFSDLINQ
jgi:hypothetical protein